MHTPVLTAIILIFIVWLQYEIRKTSKNSSKESERFWDKENKSNQIRRKDISNLNYLIINIEHLPMEDKDDETINSYRDTILTLSDKKMLNLSGYTNTDLKNMYGAANINLLSEYDNNYTLFVSMLYKWAERLYTENYKDDAVSVLEFAVSCKTDVIRTYKLLAQIYKELNTTNKINELILTVQSRTIQEKDKLIHSLQEVINS